MAWPHMQMATHASDVDFIAAGWYASMSMYGWIFSIVSCVMFSLSNFTNESMNGCASFTKSLDCSQ